MSIKFLKSDLTNGLDGVEEALGLKTGEAVFLNEYCIAPESFPDLSEPGSWVLGDTWSSLYPLPLAGKRAGLLTLGVPQSMTYYLESIGLIPKKANIIQATNIDSIAQRFYPDGSAIGNLIRKEPKPELSGKTLIPSFGTADGAKVMEASGGKTILSTRASIDFNSKSYLRKLAVEFGYSVAPGVTIADGLDIEGGVSEIRSIQEQLNIVDSRVWLKFSPAAGGGTAPIDELKSENVANWTSRFLNEAAEGYSNSTALKHEGGYKNLDSNYKRDLVLETDVSAFDGTEMIGNYGLQAVIGEDRIVYLGATEQITEDGDYLGGQTLSKEQEKFIEDKLLPEVKKVFEAYWKKGYRGVMGVDALLTKQSGKYIPYILEANCRITAATPLLGVVQKLQAINTDPNMVGRLVTFPVNTAMSDADTTMQDIFNQLGDSLYQTRCFQGVVPFIADVFPHRENMNGSKVRCVIVGKDVTEITALQTKVSARLACPR